MEASVRYGAAAGSTAAADRAHTADDAGEKGNCDPDKLLPCPFDKNHQIRACRFPYHLIKCRKNHPKLAKELRTCPFNARHLVPKHELKYHTETCEDRVSLHTEDAGSTNGPGQWQVPVSTWVPPDMSEDWDEEADDDAPPFIWGVSSVLKGEAETRPTNNLGPSFRPPNTFPWSGL